MAEWDVFGITAGAIGATGAFSVILFMLIKVMLAIRKDITGIVQRLSVVETKVDGLCNSEREGKEAHEGIAEDITGINTRLSRMEGKLGL